MGKAGLHSALPSEAEDEKGQTEERGHGVADKASGAARTQVEAEPEGSEKGKELTGQEVHLLLLRIREVTTFNSKQELDTTKRCCFSHSIIPPPVKYILNITFQTLTPSLFPTLIQG